MARQDGTPTDDRDERAMDRDGAMAPDQAQDAGQGAIKPDDPFEAETVASQAAASEETQKVPAAQPPRIEAPASRSGLGAFFGSLTAALFGAFLALLAMAYGAFDWINQTLPGQPFAEFGYEGRFKAIEKQVSQLAAQPAQPAASAPAAAQFDGLAARVGQLETDLRATRQATAALKTDLASIRVAVSQGTGAAGATGAAQPATDLGPLAAELRTEVKAEIEAMKTEVQETLAARAEAMAEQAGEAAAGGALRMVPEQLAAIENKLSPLERQLAEADAAMKALSTDVAAAMDTAKAAQSQAAVVANDLGAVKGQIAAGLAAAVKPADLAEKLAPVDRRLETIASEVAQSSEEIIAMKTREAARDAERAAEQRRVRLGEALSSLKTAIDGGAGYGKELAAVQALAPEGLDLAMLTAHSGGGVLSLAALTTDFAEVAKAVLAKTGETAPGGGSALEQLLENARSVVRVRRTGDVEGTGPEAIIARAEARLKDGKLADAVTELAGLQGAAAEPAKAWIAKAKARLAVDDALDELKTAALTDPSRAIAPQGGQQ